MSMLQTQTAAVNPVKKRSASALNAFLQCPARFTYASERLVPKDRSIALRSGTAVHAFVAGIRQGLDVEQAIQAARSSFFSDVSDESEELVEAFGRVSAVCLHYAEQYPVKLIEENGAKLVLETTTGKRWIPDLVEVPWVLPLKRLRNRSLHGVFDAAAVTEDGSLEIVELKTTSQPLTDELVLRFLNSVQFRMYALAGRQLLKARRVVLDLVSLYPPTMPSRTQAGMVSTAPAHTTESLFRQALDEARDELRRTLGQPMGPLEYVVRHWPLAEAISFLAMSVGGADEHWAILFDRATAEKRSDVAVKKVAKGQETQLKYLAQLEAARNRRFFARASLELDDMKLWEYQSDIVFLDKQISQYEEAERRTIRNTSACLGCSYQRPCLANDYSRHEYREGSEALFEGRHVLSTSNPKPIRDPRRKAAALLDMLDDAA